MRINHKNRAKAARHAPVKVACRWVWLAIVMGALLFAGVGLAQAAIPASQRAALEQLYRQTNGNQWWVNDNWLGPAGTECSWYGIICNSAGTTVIGINLQHDFLNGVLPSLDGLSDLETFDVSNVVVSGPVFFLPRPNTLYGPIPPLDGLKHLKTFNADGMQFSGDVPSLAGMSTLQRFSCVRCALDGRIGSLAGLAHLQYFAVTGSAGRGSLYGSLPELNGLSQLQYFRLDGRFTGNLPDLSGLTQLQTFRVRGFRFAGGLPELTGLPDLTWFEVHGLASGPMGELANLPALQKFVVDNNLLTGAISSPPQLPSLQIFAVEDNRLTGTLPPLASLENLAFFGVGGNQLVGSVPAPPDSLVASANEILDGTSVIGYARAGGLCPNGLTPASDPPSTIDQAWSAITRITPWSKNCAQGALARPRVMVTSNFGDSPSVPGEPVTFVATVYGANASGSVTFTAQSLAPYVNLPVITMCADVPLVDGLANCT